MWDLKIKIFDQKSTCSKETTELLRIQLIKCFKIKYKYVYKKFVPTLLLLIKKKKMKNSDQRLRTPNQDVNQRYLKNWADEADKTCLGRMYLEICK